MLRDLAKSIINTTVAPFGLQVNKRRIGREFDYDAALDMALSGKQRPFVVDIGAHIGETVKLVLGRYSEADIVCFEPNPEAVKCLEELKNNYDFKYYNIALGDKDDELEFLIYAKSSCSSLLPVKADSDGGLLKGYAGDVERRLKVQVRTLDSMLKDDIVKRDIDLLKLDVQGYEIPVLNGAKKSLQKTHYVLVEANFAPVYEGCCLADELCHYLYGEGFRLVQSIGYLPAAKTWDLVSTDLFFSKVATDTNI